MERIPSGSRVWIALSNVLVFSVTGGPQAAACARKELQDRLRSKLDPETVELAQLLLSELINNCVLHGVAARPGAWIDVAASIFPYSVKVEVCDGGPAFQHEPHAPNPDDDSGRGLYLVEQLASRWGISQHGRARVWFELPRAGPAPRRPNPRRQSPAR